LEEHRSHWGRSQDQGREDRAHAALLRRLAGHAVAGRACPQEFVDRAVVQNGLDTPLEQSSARTIRVADEFRNAVTAFAGQDDLPCLGKR